MNIAKGGEEGFLVGIVEGFYGSAWSWALRRELVNFLQYQGLNTYLYCPKSDHFLRKKWQRPWPQKTYTELEGLSRVCRENGVMFGVGLSPYRLYQRYSAAEKQMLQKKVNEINDLQPTVLAVLFDDMPASQTDLARTQSEILADIRTFTSVERILICPTWYSFDPVLETHFGQRPPDYWQQLGHLLPDGVEVLWTGNQVCSERISAADLAGIREQLGRPLVLWDNYPVNDGAQRSRHLYCHPLADRGPFSLGILGGHLCNPMNQGYLSMLPLTGLSTLYGAQHGVKHGESLGEGARRLFGEDMGAALVRDLGLFEEKGLDRISARERRQLADEYSRFSHPAAGEVVAWLGEEYAFDPACLTD